MVMRAAGAARRGAAAGGIQKARHTLRIVTIFTYLSGV